MMTKKDFIALADALRESNEYISIGLEFALCRYMREQNPRFDETRWLGYLRGYCGPNGGKIK